MHTALRPYLTTGIAIVGASVIAVAPVTVPPPDVPSVEIAAVDTVRTVTADVELTALVDFIAAFPQAAAVITQVVLQSLPLPAEVESLLIGLANAGVPAVTETFKLFTETIPTTAQNLIATGKFAHLPVLAVQAAYLGILTPPAQFLSVLVQELPLPFGTPDGLIDESFKLLIQTPGLASITILNLLADVVDSGLSPVAALAGTIDALSTALTSAVESIGKIGAAFGGALPIVNLAAPEGLDRARTLAVVEDVPAVTDTNVLTFTANSLTQQSAVETATVDPSPSQSADETGTQSGDTASVAENQSDDESPDPSDDDVTPNGATDLSDGNMAKPGTADDESADDHSDGSTTSPDDVTAVESASGAQTATTDSDTGSDEASGDE